MDALPDELLDAIVGQAGCINGVFDTATYYNIALVCRRLYWITLPYLYASIRVDLTVPHVVFSSNQKLLKRSAASLLQTLEAKCDLARYVKCVTVKNDVASWNPHERQYRADDSKLHLLLSLLPNIEKLDASRYGTSAKLPALLRPLHILNRELQTLHTLSLDIGRSLLIDLLLLFRLPRMVSLSLHYGQMRHGRQEKTCAHSDADWVHEAATAPNTTLKHLAFTKLYVSVSRLDLIRINNLCKGLESMAITNYRKSDRSYHSIESKLVELYEEFVATRLKAKKIQESHHSAPLDSIIFALKALAKSSGNKGLYVGAAIFEAESYPPDTPLGPLTPMVAQCLSTDVQFITLRAARGNSEHPGTLEPVLRTILRSVSQGLYPGLVNVNLGAIGQFSEGQWFQAVSEEFRKFGVRLQFDLLAQHWSF